MVEEQAGNTSPVRTGDVLEHDPGAGEWLPVTTAARRLRITPRAIRARIERGTIKWRHAGNTGREVWVDVGTPTGNVPEPDSADDEVELLRAELTAALVASARAEERAAMLERALAREQELLTQERDRAGQLVDELKAQLAEARRPWWRRLLGP